MKKCLFISFWVHSDKNPEGIVAKKILSGFIKNNINVDVLTSEDFEYFNGRKYIFKNYSSFIQNILNKVLSKIFGCPNLMYLYRATRFIKKNKELFNNYDIIFSRSEPIFNHLVSLYLKKKKIKSRYIFSFSDPGYLNPFLKKREIIKKMIYFFIEKKIIKEADIITYTNEYLKDIYLKKYLKFSKKMIVLENPIEIMEIEKEIDKKENTNLNKMKFCYTGTLTKERNISPVLKYFKDNDIKNFKMFIIGGFGVLSYSAILGQKLSSFIINYKKKEMEKKIRKYGYEENIIFLPFMSRKELARYIREEIDILINIDANLGEKNIFLSSKLIDYISYRKPILNFSNKGASTDFLKDFGIDYYVSYDEVNKKINNYEQLIPKLDQIKKYENSEIIKKVLRIGE